MIDEGYQRMTRREEVGDGFGQSTDEFVTLSSDSAGFVLS